MKLNTADPRVVEIAGLAAAARRYGNFAMSQPIAPFGELVAEGYHMINVGADVIGLSDFMDAQLPRFARETAAASATP